MSQLTGEELPKPTEGCTWWHSSIRRVTVTCLLPLSRPDGGGGSLAEQQGLQAVQLWLEALEGVNERLSFERWPERAGLQAGDDAPALAPLDRRERLPHERVGVVVA